MPKRPKRKVKRIAVRYAKKRVDGLYWGQAYDVFSQRYPEADVKGTDRAQVAEECRERVNKSYSAER